METYRALLEFTHDALAAYPGLGIEVFILPGTGTPYPTLTMIQVLCPMLLLRPTLSLL